MSDYAINTANKKKQKQVVTKEMRVKPHIDTHDKDTKLSQIEKFLEKEYKVKISLRLAGRQKLYADQGIKVLDELADHFQDKAIIEKKYVAVREITLFLS